MKKWFPFSAALALSMILPTGLTATETVKTPVVSATKVGVVMIRACFDQSKAGHNARDTLEKMNKQLTSSLEEIDRHLDEISAQLDDENNRDSMTPEAEKQLQDKFEALSQERELKRMQFGQQMQQSQMMIMQKIYEKVSRASKQVAEEMGFDLIVQEDSSLYFAPSLDVTQAVLHTMDKLFDDEAKEAEAASKEESKEPAKK